MPSFITVPFLLAVIVIGSAVAAALLLMAVAVRVVRSLTGRHRARLDGRLRPAVLRAIAGEGVDPELIRARGGRGRAVERLAFAYLTRVRGEGRDLLAGLLEQRGVVSRAIRRSRWPGSNSRAAAASRLGLIASPEAAARLDQMATADRSMRVRIAAARGLGRTGTAEAAVALLSLLGPPDVVPEGVVASALLELGPGAAPALRRTLESGNPGGGHRRAMAADVLGLLAMMPAWEDLIRYVRDPELPVRVSAVRALGRLGVPRAADALSPCLAPGEDGELRAVAAHALGRIGDPHSAGPLAACLGDPDYWVAHNAAQALALLGTPGRQALALAAAGNAAGAPHAREALFDARLTRGDAPGVAVPTAGGSRT